MTDEQKMTSADIIKKASEENSRGEISPELLQEAINAYNKFTIEMREFMKLLGAAITISSEPLRDVCERFNDILKANGHNTGVDDLEPVFEIIAEYEANVDLADTPEESEDEDA